MCHLRLYSFPFLKAITSPDLTWRDIQHLCVETAQIINPEDPDWEKTAVGRSFSYKYGYGKLNGVEYVNAAKNWTLVKPQTWLRTPAVQINNGSMNLVHEMTGGDPIIEGGLSNMIAITQDALDAENFETLEHITVQVWISHTKRGDVEVEVTSPNKIKSILAAPRWQDSDKNGYRGWTFMSVKHWYVFRLQINVVLTITSGARIQLANGPSMSRIKLVKISQGTSSAGE
jgi:kexin